MFSFTPSDLPVEDAVYGDDDILLSTEITNLMSQANFKAFVTDEYQKDIQRILNTDATRAGEKWAEEHKNSLRDEHINHRLHQTVLEVISSTCPGLIQQEDHDIFADRIKDYAMHLVETGQYRDLHNTIELLESNIEKGLLSDIAHNALQYFASGKFTSLLVDSFRIIGKKSREDAVNLCLYFREKIVSPLMDALTDEESLSARKFILSLILFLGDAAVPEAVMRLKDDRWYVKRNMLFILKKSGGKDALQEAALYCMHENLKVAFEALTCLLKAEDERGVTYLRKYLNSNNSDLINKSLSLSGAHKVQKIVPDLIGILRKRAIIGSDFEGKIPVVRTLGQIGDERGLEEIRGVLSSKTFLFKRSLDKLKDEVRLVLKTYDNGNASVRDKHHSKEEGLKVLNEHREMDVIEPWKA